jgi:membrane glycosyltransferase
MYACRVDKEDKPDFPVAGEDLPPVGAEPMPEEPVKERELTAMEMMGAPNRPSDNTRKTVLWISLAFSSVLFVMTLAVISFSGLDILTLLTAGLFGFMSFVLIGAVRYKGEDPMAKFDPPPRPKTKFFGRKKKK